MSNKKIRLNKNFKRKEICDDSISSILEKKSKFRNHVNSHRGECNDQILSPTEALLKRHNFVTEIRNMFNLWDISDCLEYIKKKYPQKCRSRTLLYPSRFVSSIYHDVLPTKSNITVSISQLETKDRNSAHLTQDINKSPGIKRTNSKSNIPNISFEGENVPSTSHEVSGVFQVASCPDESNMEICHEQISEYEQPSTMHLLQDDSNMNNVHEQTSEYEQLYTMHLSQDDSNVNNVHEQTNEYEQPYTIHLSQDDSNMDNVHEQTSEYEQPSTIDFSQDDNNMENVHELINEYEQPFTIHLSQDDSNIDNVYDQTSEYEQPSTIDLSQDNNNMGNVHEQTNEQPSSLHLSQHDSNMDCVHEFTSKNRQPSNSPPSQDVNIDRFSHESMNYSECCLPEIISRELKVTTIQHKDRGGIIFSVFQGSFHNEDLKQSHYTNDFVVSSQNPLNIDISCEPERNSEKLCTANIHERSNSLKNSSVEISSELTSQDESILNSFNDVSNNFGRTSPSIRFQEKSTQGNPHVDIQNDSFEKSCSEFPYKIMSSQNILHELKNNYGSSCSVNSSKDDIGGNSSSEENNNFVKKSENLPKDENVQEISHKELKNTSFKMSYSAHIREDRHMFGKKFVSGPGTSPDLKSNSDRTCPLYASENESFIDNSVDEQFNDFKERSPTILPQDIHITNALKNSSEKFYPILPFTDKCKMKNTGETNSNNSYEESYDPPPESELIKDKICELPSLETAENLREELKKSPSKYFTLSLPEDETISATDNAVLSNNFEHKFLETSQSNGTTYISKELVIDSEKMSTTSPLQGNCVADISTEQGYSVNKDCLEYPSEYARAKDLFEEEPNFDLYEKNHSELPKAINTIDIAQEERNESERASILSHQDTYMHICSENTEVDSNEEVNCSERSSSELHCQGFDATDISHKELMDILNSVSLVKTRDSPPQQATKHKNSSLDIECSPESTFMITNVPASPVSGCLHSMPNMDDFKSLDETNFSAEANEASIQKNFCIEDNISDTNRNYDKETSAPVSNRRSTEENEYVEFLTCDDAIKIERNEDVICISSDSMSEKEITCNKRKLTEGSSQKRVRRKHSEDKFHSVDTMNTEQEIGVTSKEIYPDVLEFVPMNSVLNLFPSSAERSISPQKCYPEFTFQKYVSRQDLIFRLLEWDVNWLSVQMETNCLPPIIYDCKEIKKCYNSVEEYYDTYFPLHLINIWLNMFNAWKICPNATHYDAKFEDLEENAHYMLISCSTIMTSKEFEGFPTHGGMIAVTFTKTDGNFEKLFGFIDRVMKQTYISNQNNETFRKISWEKVNFSFYTAEKPNECVQEFVKVQNLLNIENLLNQNDAMQSLEISTMKDIILKPESNKSKIEVISFTSSSTFQKLQENVNKIINCISSEDSQVILVHTSPSDHTFAVFRIVQGMIKKHCSVLVCFKDEKLFLMLATYLSEFGLILAIRESEVAIPDFLKKFVLNELIAQKMHDGCSRESVCYEIFKDCNIILTILSSMNLKDVSDIFFDGNSVCILDEANLWYESETLLLLSYNLRKMVLMSNSTKQAEVHPFLQMYGYDKSLYSRLYKIKCCM